MTTKIDIDKLANEIRRVDGNHSLGAGALAEAIMPFISAHIAEVLRGADRDHREDMRSAASEARWAEIQGEDYGSY